MDFCFAFENNALEVTSQSVIISATNTSHIVNLNDLWFILLIINFYWLKIDHDQPNDAVLR